MARRTASETPVVGRDHVRERLDALADAVRDGRGGALVLAGARGTGRTTLLATVAAHVRVAEVAGVEAEADMPWAGVQRLADAAGVALDTRDGDVPGVGAALLERLADRGPVVCLVDDAHRLDEPSLDTLAFVARRCGSLPVGIVCAVPPSDPALQRLAGLDVEPLPPLSDDDALRLVAERNSRIAPPVAAELVATAGGNPSDLCELVGALTAAQAVGGQAPPRSLPSGGRGRTAVLAAYRRLSDDAARFVLRLACADGAELAGGEPDADVLAEVQRSGLVWMAGDGPRPCSPAVGATLYDAAGERERRRAHARLADSIDPQQRRASWEWHTARADGRSDAAVADVVAAVADDHPETAALAWHRAALLTPPGPSKATRLRHAARRYWASGRSGPARRLLRQAGAHTADGPESGRILAALGEIELRDGCPEVAAHQLLLAAETLDRDEQAEAFLLAAEARRTASDTAGYLETAAKADGSLVATHLTGMASMFTGDHRAAGEALRRVLDEAGDDVRGALCAAEAAVTLGRPRSAHDRAAVAVARARGDACAPLLPTALFQFSLTSTLLDRPHAALEASTEGIAQAVANGQRNTAAEHEVLAALAEVSLGNRTAALDHVDAAQPRIDRAGLGRAAAIAEWVRACADLLDERPGDALRRLVALFTPASGVPTVQIAAVPQLVECAIRCGESDRAQRALDRYEKWATSTGTGVWVALVHRCRGLLAEDADEAERHFTTAVDLQRSGGMTLELARTELAYARRLRRQRRNREARSVLRDAFRLADDAGADYWVTQIREELRAAGERAESDRHVAEDLTPQQERIVRLVADGRTNREIAERLVISQRTVEHHLRNIFVRLGVRSRVELAATVPRQKNAPTASD